MVAIVINSINQCEKSAKFGASDNYLNVKKKQKHYLCAFN